MTTAPTAAVIATGGQVDINAYSKTIEACTKYTSGFTGNTYQNICDGSSYFVANGFWDYVLGFGVGGFLITMTLMLVVLVAKIVND